ncbi:MAG: hypothetical protein PF450_07340, partial [Bacteroidales bacterium]|nr:hypothetical protein [Bacteroidales bacterium]
YSTAQYERLFITGEIRTRKNGAFSSNGKKSRYQKVLTLQTILTQRMVKPIHYSKRAELCL